MAGLDDNISQLFDFANSALKSANATEGRISAFIPSIAGGDLNHSVSVPNMPAPTSLSGLLAEDNSASTIQFLEAESEKWLDKYFPEINGCSRNTPEEWACGILTGQQPFGLSKEVFEAVWHQGRDREYRARTSNVRQLHSEFSARGFSLPPGAQIAAITRAEEAASDAIAEQGSGSEPHPHPGIRHLPRRHVELLASAVGF